MTRAGRIISVLTILVLTTLWGPNLFAEDPPETAPEADTSQTTPPENPATDGGTPATSAESSPRPLSLAASVLAAREFEKELRRKLQQTVTYKLEEQPLDTIIAHLQTELGIPIRLDVPSLEDSGIVSDEPISGHYVGLSAGRFLNRCFEDLDLTWYIADESVVVTTLDAADERLIARSFDVSSLLKWLERTPANQNRDRFGLSNTVAGLGFSGPPLTPQAELSNILMTMAPGIWEDIDGSGGSISGTGGLFTVSQSYQTMETVDGLLQVLHHVSSRPHQPAVWFVEESGYGAQASRPVLAKLRQKMTLEVQEAGLKDVMAHLAERTDIPINLDVVSIEDNGIVTDEPITLTVTASLQSILATALQDLDLIHAPRDNGLFVTTIDEMNEQLVTALYDVRDLLGGDLVTATSLTDTIMQETDGLWDDIDGQGGSVMEVGGLMLVRQTMRTHTEIELLVQELRDHTSPRSQAIVATAPEQPTPVTQFYLVGTAEEGESLKEALITFVYPDKWEANGGTGIMQEVGSTLVVRQTPDVHKAIAAFLSELDGKRPAAD
jgi:hypothetical protein